MIKETTPPRAIHTILRQINGWNLKKSPTLPKTNSSHLKMGRNPKGKDRFPIIHLQVLLRLVSGRVFLKSGTSSTPNLHDDFGFQNSWKKSQGFFQNNISSGFHHDLGMQMLVHFPGWNSGNFNGRNSANFRCRTSSSLESWAVSISSWQRTTMDHTGTGEMARAKNIYMQYQCIKIHLL